MSQIENCSRYVPSIIDVVFDRFVAESYAGLYGDSFQDRQLQQMQMMERKLAHTEDVIQATSDIIGGMGKVIEETGEEWNQYQAAAIARLHDIGRFSEAIHFTSFNSKITGYNHSRKGTSKFLQLFASDPILRRGRDTLRASGCSLATIAKAIYYHGQKEYKGFDPYVRLIRDADKLALLRRFEDQYEGILNDFSLDPVGISPGVLEELLDDRRLVADNKLMTKTDGLIYFFTYLIDINFDATRRLILEGDSLSKIIEKLQDHSVPKETIETMINVVVEDWNKKSRTKAFNRQDFPAVP